VNIGDCCKTLFQKKNYLKGNFVIFYMLAKYVPGDIKYIFTKLYRHISTNNEANRKFVILISNFFMGRCKYKGNETFCSFKIVVCQKGT
jgi:hypothetical protein